VTRWHRMQGRMTLWNPGCDHAGIATQSVVEKQLKKLKMPTRQELGREAFLKKVWEWKEEKGGRIYSQLRTLGASLDWSREAFTMNDRCSEAVAEAFCRMHDDGLISRDDRLVNWSCALQSAISDIECDTEEIQKPTLLAVPGYAKKVEFGVMVSFSYKVEGSDREIVIATTRIETMLGDVAIAVSPGDERYANLVGKHAIHPFIEGRKLVIIEDDMVDKSFGTGAVKITPAHDEKDNKCGKRHNLPSIQVIDKFGNITEGCGEFSGMKRYEAREKIMARLEEIGQWHGKAENPMVLKICSRSGDVIEPLPVPNWFCDVSSMAADACDVVKSGELKLIPKSQESTWYHWLGTSNTRPWCISRQLWWGHRIPAYFVTVNDANVPAGYDADNKYWVSGTTEAKALEKAAKRFGVDASKITLRRDEDVLDTWFSSGIFPISIFGWPNKTEDMEKFYPGHLLETGHDILFFWVARMVMMCKYLTGKLPFKEVYLHSMVRDAHGRKMSKSKGNVIDPLEMRDGATLKELQDKLEQGNLDAKEVKKAQEGQKKDFPSGIPACGIDALRFALCAFSSVKGDDINLDIKRVVGYSQFCNKVWHTTKGWFNKLPKGFVPVDSLALKGDEPLVDRWILSRLSAAVAEVNAAIGAYDFRKATSAIMAFWKDELSGVYMTFKFKAGEETPEATVRSNNIFYLCVDFGLRILHPFMPFLTEDIWQRLPRRAGDTTESICVADFPSKETCNYSDAACEESLNRVLHLSESCRKLSETYFLGKPKTFQAEVYFKAPADDVASLKELQQTIAILSRVQLKVLDAGAAPPAGCAVVADGSLEIHMLIKGHIDLGEEVKKLTADKATKAAALAKKQTSLDGPGAAKMAPAALQKLRDSVKNLTDELAVVERAIDTLAALCA